MNSAYECIRIEHMNLLTHIAKLTRVFNTIPMSNEDKEAISKNTPKLMELTPDELQTDTDIKLEILSQLNNQTPDPVAIAPIGKVPSAGGWKERDEAKALFVDFRQAISMHFSNELDFTFLGILMTMNTKPMCAWVFKRIHEHGLIAGMAEHLIHMMNIVEVPVSKSWYIETLSVFSSLRALMLTHALEEDSKLSKLLRDNPTTAICIKKLLDQRAALTRLASG